MNNTTKRAYKIAVTAVATLLGAFLYGQTDNNDEVIDLDPFTVEYEETEGYGVVRSLSGSRFQQSIFNTPVHINILGQEYLDDYIPDEIGEAARWGISGVSTRGGDGQNMFIRGFLSPQRLRNGIPRVSYSKTPIYDVERIEVLKGPAGLLHGQVSSVGGLVNISTRQPLEEASYSLETRLDSEGSFMGIGEAAGTLANFSEGNLIHRTTLAIDRNEGHLDYDYRDVNYFSTHLRWNVNPKTQIEFESSYSDTDYNIAYTILDAEKNLYRPGSSFSTSMPWSFQQEELFINTLKFKSYLNRNIQLQLSITRTERDDDRVQHLEGTLLDDGVTINNAVFFHDQYDIWHNVYLDVLNQFTLGGLDSKLLLGASFENVDQARKFDVGGLPTTVITDPKSDRIVDKPSFDGSWLFDQESINDQIEAYVNYQGNILDDKIIFVAGARYHAFDNQATNHLNDDSVSNDSQSIVVNRYGIIGKPVDFASVYYSYSESWVFNNYILFDGTLADPSIGEQDEIGVKFNLPNNRLQATISYFDLAFTNVRTNLAPNVFAQDAEITNKGFEVDLTANFDAPSGLISVLFTYYSGDSRTADGDKQEFVPDTQASVFLRYTGKEGAVEGWYGGIGILRVGDRPGSRNANPARAFPQHDGYTIGTILLGYSNENWKFQLNIENPTDEEYVENGIFAERIRAGDPRTFKLTAKYSF